MKNLGSLLERISRSLNKDSIQRDFIIEVVDRLLSIKLSPNNIFIKNDTLFLDCSPVIKNEIKLKEREILNKLKEIHNLFIEKIIFK